MQQSLVAERTRGDIEVLARAGLELEVFLSEAVDSLARAVPHVAACVGTHDPATHLLTSARKFGDLADNNDHDGVFGQIEYDSDETTTFRALFEAGRTGVAMDLATQGEVERSVRMGRLMKPIYGYYDELRMLYREGRTFWGSISIFRGPDDPTFSADDLEFIESLSGFFARGVRGGILTRIADSTPPADAGPAVIVIDASDEIAQLSPGAAARLEQLRSVDHFADPMGVLLALVGTARRQLRGEVTPAPRIRVRAADGMWLLLHASPLPGFGDRAGDVVITIEEARPPEIVELVVSAFDLTPRERDVTQLVLRGVDTKEIAQALHVSAYTVQDHLKAIFEKLDVRSRRELIARVYFDQYEPRIGQPLAATGNFA
ncbi:helix-turn-helix transcriptional regulator [Gryllotalpicola protaetiae]|uniref:LuxR family transcriptional regulator n=1 Tax=Gryllotalpicola protaetiae TaxID=2419771 RepID=A0A387BI43_9MICO|nr:LuxR C-terminal-related transcriptional regulator [Gryllotalpicola protaetiae]AYG03493.1 LuxR family transcriptional regulator [Gryllotalpicola protaetiae]